MSKKREAKYPTRRVLVAEVDSTTYEHVRYIWFDMPCVVDPGGYVAIGSYNAFFHGMKNRNHSPRFLYYGSIDRDIDHQLQFNYPYHIHTPNIVVKTIWEFYNLIGYDYKKNQYKDGKRKKTK